MAQQLGMGLGSSSTAGAAPAGPFNDICLGMLSFLESHEGVCKVAVTHRPGSSLGAISFWHRKNAPYQLPEDVKAFLLFADGMKMQWDFKWKGQLLPLGRASINGLNAFVRVPIECWPSDDPPDQSVLASLQPPPHTPQAPPALVSVGGGAGGMSAGGGTVRVAVGGGSAGSGSGPPPAPSSLSGQPRGLTGGRAVPVAGEEQPSAAAKGAGARGASPAAALCPVAAFDVDAMCTSGRVALVYNSGPTQPQVWFQDLACDWSFVAASFSDYFRLMVLHLGLPHWQYAFTPTGLDPETEQWLRLMCPERLVIDLEQRRRELEKWSGEMGSRGEETEDEHIQRRRRHEKRSGERK